MTQVVLTVERLGVTTTGADARPILHEVTFALDRGASVGLVGPSGAGKSTVGNAILGLLPPGLALTPASRILLGGDNLRTLGPEPLRRIRGRRIAMVFQEPLLALTPAMRIGDQLTQVLRAHGVGGEEAQQRAESMLEKVGLPDAAVAAERYAHQLSGGQRQRVLLALALLLEPEVLVADEPTTALDPVLQAELLELLDALRAVSGTSLLLISHDLELVAERCQRVIAIDGGRVAEDGPALNVLATRRTPTSLRAIRGTPGGTLLQAEGVAVHFAMPRSRRRAGRTEPARAVDGVSLTLAAGECLGIVGESGGGKTTLARALLGLAPLTAGRVVLAGRDVGALDASGLRELRRHAQLIPQDAGASLTPERLVGELIGEVLDVHGLASGTAAEDRVQALLAEVGLPGSLATRRPGTLSSGQRQRVAIARALACEPQLLICDEPVANVDAGAREHLLALLDRLRAERGLGLIMISHDVDAVRRIATRVAVMYLGQLVEEAASIAPLENPRMPYTQVLCDAAPDPARRRERWLPLAGGAFRRRPRQGCPFEPRCPHPLKDPRCRGEHPTLQVALPSQPDHRVACWHDPLPPSP